jgi:hypothetical protein
MIVSWRYEGEFDAGKGNTSETGIGQPSAVRIFLGGGRPLLHRIEQTMGKSMQLGISPDFDSPEQYYEETEFEKVDV